MSTQNFATGQAAKGATAVASPQATQEPEKPVLVFYSPTNGRSRRVEGFLAQVLQRRHNHHTFSLHRVNCETHPELAARLGIEQMPALLVIEAKRVRAKLEQPHGCNQITAFLSPWLK